MLRSMAEAVAELGYAKTPVAEVLRRAGVSRETFYEHFANKEECFLAAYDGAVEVIVAEMTRGGGGAQEAAADPRALLDSVLERYLTVLSREPAVARTFLVEVYAAGPGALARRVESQARFAEVVAALAGAKTKSQRFACEAVVAAASALVTQRVCAGTIESALDLHKPLSAFMHSALEAEGLLGATTSSP
jgi:AcrR family transcriptional regulator